MSRSSSHPQRSRSQPAPAQGQPLLALFLNALQTSGAFMCLPCAAVRIGSDTQTLTSQMLMTETWSGYSFASATCGTCGERAYCAIGVGQAEV